MKKKQIVVEGFCFTQEEAAEQARREAEGIQYIIEHTDMKNPAVVQQLYQKMIEENLFETPVGLSFLKKIRDYLLTVPSVKGKEPEAIPVKAAEKGNGKEENRGSVRGERAIQAEQNKAQKQVQQAKKNLRASLMGNLFLVLLVIGMAIITMTSDNPNIVNYESKLLDKYSQWQQELEEREQAVREQERRFQTAP